MFYHIHICWIWCRKWFGYHFDDSSYCFIIFSSGYKHCLQSHRIVFYSGHRNWFHAIVVLFWIRTTGIFTHSPYCFDFGILFYRFRFGMQTLFVKSSYCFHFGSQELFSNSHHIILISDCSNFHTLNVLFWLWLWVIEFSNIHSTVLSWLRSINIFLQTHHHIPFVSDC